MKCFRNCHIHIKLEKKRRRHKKPWWNDSLADKWNQVCQAERNWLKRKDKNRNELKNVFIRIRKDFDREVQRAKRIGSSYKMKWSVA